MQFLEAPLSTIIGFVILAGIFSWNSYAIFHNISGGVGVGWTIIGIIVNLAILFPLMGAVGGLIEKFKKGRIDTVAGRIGIYCVPLLLLIFFGLRGGSSYKNTIMNGAEEIIEDATGYEVERIMSLRKIDKNLYSAKAVFASGEIINIEITVDGEMFYVQYKL